LAFLSLSTHAPQNRDLSAMKLNLMGVTLAPPLDPYWPTAKISVATVLLSNAHNNLKPVGGKNSVDWF